MITISGLGLKDVIYFKEARAVLNKAPLTFVRGANLDADPATPTGNGAGKSLLFGAIPTVVYASPPTTTRKKAKKEILGKKSEIGFDCIGSDGHKYNVLQTASKYKIFKDGKDIEIRTVPLAEEYIRDTIFPLTEIEYYTHGYLSTLRPFLMRSDTDANRMEHFSQIFRLNDYDGMRGYFTRKLRTLKDNEIRLSVLEQKTLGLKEKLVKVSKKVSKSDLTEARDEHKLLDKKIQQQVQVEFDLNSLQGTLRTLVTIEKELDELRSKYEYKDHPSKRLAILKDQKALVKKWDNYNSLLKAYTKSIKSTQEKIDSLKLPKTKKEELESSLTSLKKKHEALEAQIEKIEDQKDEYDRLVKKAKPIAAELESEHGINKGDKVDLKKDHTPDIEATRAQLRLKSLLEHEHRDGNNCPTCMSEVDIDNIKRVVKKAREELPRLEKKKAAQDLYRQIKELRAKIVEIDFDADGLAKLKKQESKLTEEIESVREQVKVWKRYDELQSVLSDIEKPKAPKEEAATKLSYSELDEHIELCNEILSHVASKNKLMENNPSVAEFKSVKAVKVKMAQTQIEIDAVHSTLTKNRQKMAKVSDVIEKQAAYKSEYDLYTKELAEAQTEIDKLRPEIEDKKVLEVLIKAYSSKGLKSIAANQICRLLEANLNHYRHLIFAEAFSFTIHASDTGLSIIVDRNNGIISDVRNLSGAESNCFSLLFLMALLPLIPDERRLSMVVLDEPTAHMDDVSRNIFIERFLPALMEVVPHIYVITPNDEYLPGSCEWLIQKSRGVSKLITDPHTDLNAIKEAATAINRARISAKKTKPRKSRKRETA